MRIRKALVAGALLVGLTACTSSSAPDPIFDELPDALTAAIAAQDAPVSTLILQPGTATLNTNVDGRLVIQVVVPAGEPADSGPGLVGISAADFPAKDLVDQARTQATQCPKTWGFTAQALSSSAVQTTAGCDGASVAKVNGTELPALGATWDVATFTTLWSEIKLISPGMLVRQLAFDPQTGMVLVGLPLDAQNSPGCSPMWARHLAQPASSGPTCMGDGKASDLKLIDLNSLTPERLVTLMHQGLGELPGADASQAYLLVDGYQVTIEVGSQQTHVPYEG